MEDRTQINPDEVRFFSGSSHPQLAQGIANYLGVPLEPTKIKRFSNDNMYIQLGASVRSRNVFIVQSLFSPVNDHLVELLIMLDAARSAAATEVHAVIPYYSFARSDKKDTPRISITARLVANLLQTAGATHVMTMMLHSPQVHGFFSVPTDHLSSMPVFASYFRDRDLSDTTVVTPDIGHAKRGAELARELGLPMAAVSKKRVDDATVVTDGLIGEIRGSKVILLDDEIALGTSMITAVKLLRNYGVTEASLVCTHGIFCGPAIQNLQATPEIKEIVTTNTVAIPPEKRMEGMHVLSVAPLFADAIRRIHSGETMQPLFDY